jgi:hypothetical protein
VICPPRTWPRRACRRQQCHLTDTLFDSPVTNAAHAGPELVQTVRRWWFEADAWRDPATQRQFLARMNRYQQDGPPPAHQRTTREEIRAQYGV